MLLPEAEMAATIFLEITLWKDDKKTTYSNYIILHLSVYVVYLTF